MLAAIRQDNSGPTLSTRNLAILNLAAHDALNSILGLHQPYRFQVETEANTLPEAAVIGAGYEVMLSLYPSFDARTESLYRMQLAVLPASQGATNGLELGREVARRYLTFRAADGATTEIPYIPSAEAGQWRRTPPLFRPPMTPHWGQVELFCLPGPEQFLPSPPPALQTPEYAKALEEVRLLGGLGSTARTEEQSLIARFWSDFSYTAMPPGHWHEIAAVICAERQTSLADTARLFALIALAQADTAIVCWAAKFHWNLWRPITAIGRADEDGNPQTSSEALWDDYLDAPPFPAYPSGHSSFSAASARVLTHFYGTDEIRFSVTSDSVPGVARSFTSLKACADEIGMSRIYGGIHFQFDNVEGKRMGDLIGDYVTRNFLLRTEDLPQVRIEGIAGEIPSLRVHAKVGQECVLEWSADLNSWQTISTNVAAAGGVLVQDQNAAGRSAGFYRVRQ